MLSAQIGLTRTLGRSRSAGAVIELVHLATLYHDDVMDEAQVRRGAPLGQRQMGQQHRDPGRRLSVRDGVATGVALGPDAVRIIAETFAQLVTGQMRETKGRSTARIPSSTIFPSSLRQDGLSDLGVGPIRGDVLQAPPMTRSSGSRLGGLVGTAFQISDDIIDIDSDPDESGKVPGRTCAKVHLPVPAS